jgi:hypothetical protein
MAILAIRVAAVWILQRPPPNSLSQTNIFRAQLASLYIADDLPAPVPTDSSAMAVPVITRVAAAAKMRSRMIEN